jgi:hypothetical protein
VLVDGTFLTGKYRGVLMIAVGVDPNNQIEPLVFGLVEGENRDGSRSGSGQILAGFGSCGFGFGDGFSPTVFGFGFRFGIGFGFEFGFSPMDIQWISEINHLELKLMFYNMLIITCLLRLLNLFKIDS